MVLMCLELCVCCAYIERLVMLIGTRWVTFGSYLDQMDKTVWSVGHQGHFM